MIAQIKGSHKSQENIICAPLTFSQQSLWMLELVGEGKCTYNVGWVLHFQGPLDLFLLNRSFRFLIQRHSCLRTVFSAEGMEPQQVILPEVDFQISSISLFDLPREEQLAEVKKEFSREVNTPFDLINGPLFRSRLLHTSTDEHYLVMGVHHIVTDGWSMVVLLKELANIYDHLGRGEEPELPLLPLTYHEYAVTQAAADPAEISPKGFDYWQKQLSLPLAKIELPTDFPRTTPLVEQGGRCFFRISQQTDERIKEACKKEKVTPYMYLLTVFKVLLHRYTAQNDLMVGTPVANRGKRELFDMFGFFVNVLVLRSDYGGNISFSEALSREKQTVISGMRYMDVPLGSIVKKVNPSRSSGFSQIFQVMFVMQNVPIPEYSFGEVKMTPVNANHLDIPEYGWIHGDTGWSEFDLTLELSTHSSGIVGAFEYNSTLFKRSTIEALQKRFTLLLDSVLEDPSRHLDSLAFLLPEDKEQLRNWNETVVDFDQGKSIIDLFTEQVQRSSDRTALVFEGEEMSYGELDRKSSRLAHYLQKNGVSDDTLTAICLERSFDMVVSLFAVLKSGGAYVPLDASYPEERLAYMLNDCRPPVIISSSRLLSRLPQYDGLVIDIDTQEEMLREQSPLLPAISGTPDSLAYVIYTSGSTGKPKGVMISRSAISNHMHWIIAEHHMGETDVLLQKTPFSFDASVWEFYAPLLSGGRLVIAKPGGHQDPEYMCQTIQEQGVTLLQLVPSVLGLLLEQKTFQQCTSLRRLFCGGEALSVKRVERFYNVLKNAKLINLYGPTEATIDATSSLCLPGAPMITIGRPVANCQAYVLDANHCLLPKGVQGELYLAGVGLARGYLNKPELTEASFIERELDSASEPIRLYKTGDLVRWLDDGTLQYMGRTDHQVKLRGFRIELGEIEDNITSSNLVRENVVVVDGEGGSSRLVAYIVSGKDKNITAKLQETLQQRLPEYMVPDIIVELDVMPHTASGKIDRQSLPAPGQLAQSAYVPPDTPREREMVTLWQELFGIDRVGLTDNFFDLGGHSLLAMQLVSRLRDRFAVEINLRCIFETPTPAALINIIEQEQQKEEIPPVTPLSAGAPLQLSFVQQRLWFLDQMEGDGSAYSMPAAFTVAGKLNIDALNQSFFTLTTRHDSLRMSFSHVEGEAVLHLIEPYFPLSTFDFSHLQGEERQNEVKRCMGEHVQQPFDLSTGKLLRVQLLHLALDRNVLLFNMHHIISDGWSLGVLVTDLKALYESFDAAMKPALPPLSIQYQDFAHWQREWLQGEVIKKQLDYWNDQLADCPPALNLPTDRPRPDIQTHRGAHLLQHIGGNLPNTLATFNRKEGVSLFMTLLSSFYLLLTRYSSQMDICVGTPVAGRNNSQLENLIGFFSNTLVLRCHLDTEATVEQLLAQVKETCLDAYANQDTPFEQIVETVNPERSLGHSPLFQVMLVLQNTPMEELALSEVSMIPMELQLSTAKFDITLSVEEKSDGLLLDWEYNTDLFNRETMERMAAHFQNLLQGITANSAKKIVTLPMLTTAEKDQFRQWNATQAPFPKEKTVVDLFEEMAVAYPESPALIFGDTPLRYEELDQLSNHLARQLMEHGVATDVLVVVCLERSLEMIIAILAVWKAGGGYVPVDPGYPADRLSYMVEDSQAAVVISSETLLKKLPKSQAAIICVQLENLEKSLEPVSVPRNPNSLAYMIYTSGSTGKPKGVCCGHSGVVNLLSDFQNRAALTSEMSCSFWTSLSFDVSVYEMFSALTTGACLHIVPEEVRNSGAAFCRWLDDSNISSAYIPPFMLSDFAAWLKSHPGRSKLHRMVVGVEPIEEELLASFMRRISTLQIINGYGPTEATICSTLYSVDKNTSGVGRTPMGKAVQNSDLYVLDANRQLVPILIPGELYIGGAGLARGYWQRDDLTSKSFISSPFFMDGGSPRLYGSGDLVRWHEDGNLEFMGRIDNQVKVRGFRIELGEIESAVMQANMVHDTVVVARKVGSGTKQLVAYVATGTPATDGTVSENLKEYLSTKLPEYMVPSVIVELESLPLGPNGKLDRKALPKPEQTAGKQYVAPSSPLEKELVEMWQELLEVERIGIDDNFFDLGGHSLLTVRIIAKIRESKKIKISLDAFFKNPSIRGLAQEISGNIATDAHVPLDLTKEAVLSPDICGDDQTATPLAEADHIFITGVTGFVGAFLLQELLNTTSADIHCLVRAQSEENGLTRICEGLKSYKLWDPQYAKRIIPIPGDLARPGLGIDPDRLRRLESEIDVIFHNGALVHHMLPYENLKSANVDGTLKVLRLASRKKIKSVHFISTLNVFSSSVGKFPCTETSPIEQEIQYPSAGYPASKWVSEKLVSLAGEQRIPVTIYRLGLVAPDSRTGACGGGDHMDLLVRTCVSLGCYPGGLPPVQVIPVDILASYIVSLAGKEDLSDKVFHLFNPDALSPDWIMSTYHLHDTTLTKIDAQQWFSMVEETMDGGNPLPIMPYLPMYQEIYGEYQMQDSSQAALYGCDLTVEYLKKYDLQYPPVTADTLHNYFSFLNEKGLL